MATAFGRSYLQRKARATTVAAAAAEAEAQARAVEADREARRLRELTAAAQPPAAPPLMRGLPPASVAWVCGFLSSRDLGRLACVARGFTQPILVDPDGNGKVSVVEEGAALAAMRYAQTLIVQGPRPDRGETWLHMLRTLEGSLAFTAAGLAVEFSDGGAVVRKDGLWQSAVCGTHEMVGGSHFAEFTLERAAVAGSVCIGVVSSAFNPVSDWLPAHQSGAGWMFGTHSGALWHGGGASAVHWEGMPGPNVVQEGDSIGLLVDLVRHRLTVYRNGRKLGVMLDDPAALTGPLRWAVDVSHGAAVRIEGKDPPALTWAAARAATNVFLQRRPASAPADAVGKGWAVARRGRRQPWRPMSAIGRFGDGTRGHMPTHLSQNLSRCAEGLGFADLDLRYGGESESDAEEEEAGGG